MNNLLKLSLLACIFTVFLGCSKDDSNPNATIKLAVTTTSSTTSIQAKSSTQTKLGTNDLVFNSGSITISEIEFEGNNNNVSVSRFKEQVATIDYATGVVTPEVKITIPAGNYTNVNLGIELLDENSTPSVVIEGTYTNSNDVIIPIRFEYNSGEVFEANSASVVMGEGTDVIGKITFDAISWFSVVTAAQLDNATLTEGTIIISGTSNENIFDIVADKLDVDTEAVFQ